MSKRFDVVATIRYTKDGDEQQYIRCGTAFDGAGSISKIDSPPARFPGTGGFRCTNKGTRRQQATREGAGIGRWRYPVLIAALLWSQEQKRRNPQNAVYWALLIL